MNKDNKNKHILIIFLTIIMVLVITSVVGVFIYIKDNTLAIPGNIIFNTKDEPVFDMQAHLCDGHFTLQDEKGNIVWESEKNWKVQDFLVCDIDSDSDNEILLLTWKKGSFGKHLPFWVNENDTDTGQHIYIYEKREEAEGEHSFLRASWMSSALKETIISWSFDTRTRLRASYEDGSVRYFNWNSWGLKAFTIPSSKVTFTAVGDTIAHKQIYNYALDHENGTYDFLYANVSKRISESDLSAVVQETPFADDASYTLEDISVQRDMIYSEYPVFSSPSGIALAQEAAGFDIIACATNHMLDQGIEGIDRTYHAYGDDTKVIGILPSDKTGDTNLNIIEKNGISIALFDYTYGTNGKPIPKEYTDCINILSDENKVKEELTSARSQADVVMVFVHWGEEYSSDISDYQSKWTDIFYECGVNVVIGSHPHVLQPYELIEKDGGQQMLIYYSLGNSVSGQNEIDRILGGMASFTINKTVTEDGMTITLTDYELEPIVTHQEKQGIYTAYFLRDYTDSLASMHRLNPVIAKLWVLYDDETKK